MKHKAHLFIATIYVYFILFLNKFSFFLFFKIYMCLFVFQVLTENLFKFNLTLYQIHLWRRFFLRFPL